MSTGRSKKLLASLVMLVGLLVLIAGVIYLTVKADSLPSFMGTLRHAPGHRYKRGLFGVIVGPVLLIAGAGLLAYRPRFGRR